MGKWNENIKTYIPEPEIYTLFYSTLLYYDLQQHQGCCKHKRAHPTADHNNSTSTARRCWCWCWVASTTSTKVSTVVYSRRSTSDICKTGWWAFFITSCSVECANWWAWRYGAIWSILTHGSGLGSTPVWSSGGVWDAILVNTQSIE